MSDESSTTPAAAAQPAINAQALRAAAEAAISQDRSWVTCDPVVELELLSLLQRAAAAVYSGTVHVCDTGRPPDQCERCRLIADLRARGFLPDEEAQP